MDTAGTGIRSVQIYSAFYQVDKYAVPRRCGRDNAVGS